MRRQIQRLVAACISTAMLLIPGVAAEEQKTIKFDILMSYPYAYIDSEGDKVGVFWEYADLLAQKSGLRIAREIVPKARIIANLKGGLTDLSILFESDSLGEHSEFIANVHTIPIVVATQKGMRVERYDDLKSLSSVGVLRSGAINPEFDSDQSINKYFASNYSSLVEMLAKNRLSVVVGNSTVILALIERLCLQEDIDVSPLVMKSNEQRLVMSKKSENLDQTERLQAAAESLEKEGVLSKLYDFHTSYNSGNCSRKAKQ